MTAKTTRTAKANPTLDKEMTAVKDTVPPVVTKSAPTPAKARATKPATKAAAKPAAKVAPKVAAKAKPELPANVGTCGAVGCSKKAVHEFDWSTSDADALKAHRNAYHAGTFRASVRGWLSLMSLVEAGKPVAYGKRGDAKPKANAKPKSAGTSPKSTRAAKAKATPAERVARTLHRSTPPTPPKGPIARVKAAAPATTKVVATA